MRRTRSYSSLAKPSTSSLKPRYMAPTVSCRMKHMSDYVYPKPGRPRPPNKPRSSRNPRLLLDREATNPSTSLMNVLRSPARSKSLEKSSYGQRHNYNNNAVLPTDFEALSTRNGRSRERDPNSAELKKFAQPVAYQPSSRRPSTNIYRKFEDRRPSNKGSMFSLNVNKQISDKFGLATPEEPTDYQAYRNTLYQNNTYSRTDGRLVQGKVDMQPQYQKYRDQRHWSLKSPSLPRTYNSSEVQLQKERVIDQIARPLQKERVVDQIARPVEAPREISPSVKEVLKKLNEKVNKLYSWQISELDVVAKLAGEIQTLKRPLSRAASTSALRTKQREENLMSTRLGKILLNSLSESLQQIASEANDLQEESKENPLSSDNLMSLKSEIARLSSSLKASATQKEKVEIIKSYNAGIGSQGEQIRVNPLTTKQRRFAREKVRTPQAGAGASEERNVTSSRASLETELPKIVEEQENLDVKPLSPLKVVENVKIDSPKTQPKHKEELPTEISGWISELNDEIITTKMTLQHVIELAIDPQGLNSQRFKDFAHMVENSHMLQPFLLPDTLANWLPTAKGSQVGAIRELTQLLQSIKESIKSVVAENDQSTIKRLCVEIQNRGILERNLPTLDLKGT